MTKINRMVLHGFKSFAKKTELIFGEGFNCVLGPNGSGKSNILDALCFVLGKSSAKSMRAEKAANLIYNGGKTKKPAQQAEVSIYFDNSNKIFPTEDEEVKITRIVKPSGQGVYKINDQVRTRAQILELLGLAKIDPDGYNIILQGDIIKIIDMTSTERRQIIEEIAGISVYEDKKQKAVRELERVDGRLKEADIILAERETYLKELKKERDQAQKYKVLDSKIMTNKATALYRQIQQKVAEHEELKERSDKYVAVLEKKNEEIKVLKEEIAARKKEVDDINKELEKRGEKDQITIHKVVEEIKIDLVTSKNRISSVKDEIDKIKARKAGLKETLDDVEQKIRELKAQKKTFEDTLKQKEKEKVLVEERIKKFREKHNLDNIGDIEKEIDDLDKEAEELQKSASEIRQKQQDLLREKDRLEFQIQAVDEKINKVLSVEEENKEQIGLLKKKKEEFKKLAKELSEVQARETAVAAELADSRRKLFEAQEQVSRLGARQAQIMERSGASIAVKKILENKKRFPGVHGTVSDLGEVSSKYSLALEVAAGQKIKSVVVENDRVASDCIRFIKNNKLGVATFIPMNKVRPKPEDPRLPRLLKMPGVHGKAVDLVSYDPKFEKVFRWVFESTLIVQDLATARKIGIGEAKMVTLDGDITELSGSMTGGFRQKRQGLGFSEKEVSDSLKHYEKVQADMSSRVSKLESEKSSFEDKIARIRELKASLEGEIIKMEKSLHLDHGDLDVNKKLKEELKKKVSELDSELDKVVMSVSENNRALANNKIKRQKLRENINRLRAPTLIAELNAFEEKKQELIQSLIKIEHELKNIDTQITSLLEPERANILKIMKQHDKELADFHSEIKDLEEHIRIKNSELKEKEKVEKEFYSQFQDLFSKKNKLDKAINKRESKVFVLADEVRRTEHKINTISVELAKIAAQKAGLEKEFEQYEGVEIDHEKSDAQLTREINQFERMVENLGAVNMRALEIYDTVEKEYNELNAKKAGLEKERSAVIEMMNEIEGKKKVLFMKTFDVLQTEFQRVFSKLLDKGEASLVLENPDSPFEGGLDIKVRLTGTKFLDIRSLSGGEKTMTALAFLFSVQNYEPACFYVLDEVDAALDKKNSEKLATLVKSYASKAQYILISHNDGVISEATNLYGVSMDQHGVSDVVTLKI